MGSPELLRTLPRALVGGLAVLSLWCFECGDIDEREITCEDGVAYLKKCCAGFQANGFRCRYTPGSCEHLGTYPDISETASDCVRAMSCDELRTKPLVRRDGGSETMCERALALEKSYAVTAGTSGYSREGLSCP